MPTTITKDELIRNLDLLYRCAIESELYTTLTAAERGDLYDTIRKLPDLIE